MQFDKGGKLYQPSTILQRLLGPNLTPIEFQALYQWSDLGDADTIVLGASKPSDFDESLGVLQRFRLDDPATKQMVVDAANRIRAALDAACGPGGLNQHHPSSPPININISHHHPPSIHPFSCSHILYLHPPSTHPVHIHYTLLTPSPNPPYHTPCQIIVQV